MKSNFGRCIIYILVLFSFLSCDLLSGKKEKVEVEIVELDQLPMYGSSPEYGSLQKNADQLEADRLFLLGSDEVQPSRVQACKDYVEFGWFYLNQGDSENAMRRANQAWQLDSTNPDPYILFAAILNAREDNVGALNMLYRGISMQPEYISLYDMYLSESVDIYRQTGDNQYIKKLLSMLNDLVLTDDALTQRVDKLRQDAELYLK